MKPFPRTTDVDHARFAPDLNQPEVLFGLPEKVAFCSSCVISNQRPNAAPSEFDLKAESQKSAIGFDEEGVCDACRVWEMKHETIDWGERERELRDLLTVIGEATAVTIALSRDRGAKTPLSRRISSRPSMI